MYSVGERGFVPDSWQFRSTDVSARQIPFLNVHALPESELLAFPVQLLWLVRSAVAVDADASVVADIAAGLRTVY